MNEVEQMDVYSEADNLTIKRIVELTPDDVRRLPPYHRRALMEAVIIAGVLRVSTSEDAPLAVNIRNFPASTEIANDAGNPVPVAGIVALDAATLAALESVGVTVSNFPASTEIANDAGNPVPVSGIVALDAATLAALESVGVNNFPAIQVVDGVLSVDNFPAVQPVSGAVGVNNFPAVQPVSGAVAVNNLPTLQKVELGFNRVGLHNAGAPANYDAAATLATPATATKILIQVFAQSLRYRLDGVDPAAAVGFQIKAGDAPTLIPVPAGSQLRVIGEAAGAVVQYQWGN